MKKLTNLVLIGLFTLFICSCNLDYFEQAEFGDIVFDPSVAIPVGEITYSIEELFEELNDAGSNVSSTSENVVSLIYEEELQSQSASSFLAILDQNFSTSLSGGRTVTAVGTPVTFSVSESFDFDLTQRGSESYDSIYFSGGDLSVVLSSDFDATVDYIITINSLEDNAVPLSLSGTLTPSSNRAEVSRSLDNLVGRFNRDKDGNAASNKFVFTLAYDLTVASGATVNATDAISFDFFTSNTSFDSVFGDVSTQDLTVSFDVVNLDFLNSFGNGSIAFADPRITLVFENSFGFPLGVSFPEFAVVTDNGTIIELEGSVVDNQSLIAAPRVEERGQILMTELELNKSNSNIATLLSSQPSRIVVDVNTETNPPITPFQYNFVDQSSILDISVDIEIPLDLTLDDIEVSETVDFGNGTDLEDARRLLFRVVSENELPLGGDVQLEFMDDADNILHIVNEQDAFLPAPVGSNGRTTEVVTNAASIILEDANIRAIENATKINVIATLRTTNAQANQAVKFFDDYELKFKLAVQADVAINSNGN